MLGFCQDEDPKYLLRHRFPSKVRRGSINEFPNSGNFLFAFKSLEAPSRLGPFVPVAVLPAAERVDGWREMNRIKFLSLCR